MWALTALAVKGTAFYSVIAIDSQSSKGQPEVQPCQRTTLCIGPARSSHLLVCALFACMRPLWCHDFLNVLMQGSSVPEVGGCKADQPVGDSLVDSMGSCRQTGEQSSGGRVTPRGSNKCQRMRKGVQKVKGWLTGKNRTLGKYSTDKGPSRRGRSIPPSGLHVQYPHRPLASCQARVLRRLRLQCPTL